MSRLTRRHRHATAVAAAVAVLVAGLAAATITPLADPSVGTAAAAQVPVLSAVPTVVAPKPLPARPPVTATADGPYRNVVVVMTDDMSTALLDANPRLAAIAAQGVRFDDYVVADSLCCTSRTTFLTGQFIHNHGVLSNMATQQGGWTTFAANGLNDDNLGLWLQSAGITTGYVGKYLNGFPDPQDPAQAPRGWDRVFIPDHRSYNQNGYHVNDDGRWMRYVVGTHTYNTDVLADEAIAFVEANEPRPFFLTVAPFSPHLPATPPQRYADRYADARYPAGPALNVQGPGEPEWLTQVRARTPEELAGYEETWRNQLRASDAIADLIDGVLGALDRTGQRDDTLVLLMSDNGMHYGEHRLPLGKRTAYDEDVVVPLVLLNPSLAPVRIDAPASGVDLAPTILAAYGLPAPARVDGRDLLPLTRGEWWPRGSTYTEHRTSKVAEGDPDADGEAGPDAAFRSIRTADWVYVEYDDGSRQLFATSDTAQLTNLAATASPALLASLQRLLQAHASCAGQTCRLVDRIGGLTLVPAATPTDEPTTTTTPAPVPAPATTAPPAPEPSAGPTTRPTTKPSAEPNAKPGGSDARAREQSTRERQRAAQQRRDKQRREARREARRDRR